MNLLASQILTNDYIKIRAVKKTENDQKNLEKQEINGKSS